MAKTTLDDIAREAGCSRATIYRVFPGGKSAVMLATGEAEVQRLLVDLADRARRRRRRSTTCSSWRMVRVGRGPSAAHEALQYLLVHEPEHLLVHVSFDALDPLLARGHRLRRARTSSATSTPGPRRDGAEWIARLIVVLR